MKDTPSSIPRQKTVKTVKTNQPRSARQHPWTKEEDALLGKLNDRVVAEKLNRSLCAVRGRRKFLGKTALGQAPQSFHRKKAARDPQARLFATKSNQELQALLGWSYKRILTRRRQLAAGQVKKRAPAWTLEEDRLLGTKPDQVLARKFGRTVNSVRARRGQKRIRLYIKLWRPEDDRILGTRTDREIALLLGRTLSCVAARRKKLGIPSKNGRRWSPEEEALLGTEPDQELARTLGRSITAVQARRYKLHRSRPGFWRHQPRTSMLMARYRKWTAEDEALLGKFTDEEVAHKLGFPQTRVRRRRYQLGVPCFNPHHRQWTKAEIALLGTRPDREVAKLVNRSVGNVRYKRLSLRIPFQNPHYEIWKPEELALLGKLPDKEVARRTGHSLASVRRARCKRRIFSVRRAGPEWQPAEEALLGTRPDAEIAAHLNRTVIAVAHRRVIKGIPPWPGPWRRL